MVTERDSLRSRLSAARSRIDALLERLPADGGPAGAAHEADRSHDPRARATSSAAPTAARPCSRAAVASVDREMSAIRDAGKVKARERIAVLAALNLAYQLADRPQRTPAHGCVRFAGHDDRRATDLMR